MQYVLSSPYLLSVIWVGMNDASRRRLRMVSRTIRDFTYPLITQLSVRRAPVPPAGDIDMRSALRWTTQMPLPDTFLRCLEHCTLLNASLDVKDVMPFLMRCTLSPLSSRLRSLRLTVHEVTQETVLAIRVAFPHIRDLIIQGPIVSIGGRAFDPLLTSDLQSLSLEIADLSPDAIRSMGSLTSLRTLNLITLSSPTVDGMTTVPSPWTALTTLTKLERATFGSNDMFPDILVFMHALTRLTHLTLDYEVQEDSFVECASLTRNLCSMRHLRYLDVASIEFDYSSLAEALLHMPELITLRVNLWNNSLRDVAVSTVWRLPLLKHIIVSSSTSAAAR